MSQVSRDVLEILRSEMAKMLTSLKADTPENFRRKANNFLLSRFDPEIIFYAVFTSSFESKSGNAMENCAKAIARLRYGDQAVPPVILGLGATPEDGQAYPVTDRNKQVILTRKNVDQVSQSVRTVLSRNRSTGRRQTVAGPQGVTQALLATELRECTYADSTRLEVKPVDLFIHIPEGNSLCMEIKLGGDLDSSNAPAQISKFLTTCVLADVADMEGYFATIYNKNGEGNRFTGTVRSYLADDMILAGSAFWSKILPPEIAFEEFVKLYHQSLDDTGMNEAIRVLVNDTTLLTTTEKEQVASELTEEYGHTGSSQPG